jgi:hypothetical protein
MRFSCPVVCDLLTEGERFLGEIRKEGSEGTWGALGYINASQQTLQTIHLHDHT